MATPLSSEHFQINLDYLFSSLQQDELLQKMGYYKDIGYQKGWYKHILPYEMCIDFLTKEEIEQQIERDSLGILYYGTNTVQLIKDELGI